jgi:hypothetical protein
LPGDTNNAAAPPQGRNNTRAGIYNSFGVYCLVGVGCLLEVWGQFMSILVLGHGGHGKGTFAKMLAERLSVTTASSSEVALPYIWPTLELVTGSLSPDHAYANRHKHRLLWKELISLLNTPDKSTLARLLLAKHVIYDGMRCEHEYRASNGLFPLIFWVDASDRLPKDPSMTITFNAVSMQRIDNNEGLEKLEAYADYWAEAIKRHVPSVLRPQQA